jgi:putative ATPase
MAPKSNTAYKGIDLAMDYVSHHPDSDIPNHLRDAHYKSAKKLGHGAGYLYPHDYPNHWVLQQYLPDAVIKERFFYNSKNGHENQQCIYQDKVQNPEEGNK